MKAINEYLKKRALLKKRYELSENKPSRIRNSHYRISNNRCEVIGSIDEVINSAESPVTEEFVDNFIRRSYGIGGRTLFTASPRIYWRNIHETLITSHDWKKLVEVLKRYIRSHYGVDDVDKVIADVKEGVKAKAINIIVRPGKFADDLYRYVWSENLGYEKYFLPDELVQILDFFNYYISDVDEYDGGTAGAYSILLEPKYSENVTNLIYEKYNGILYHVTLKEHVDRILKRGLQLRGGTLGDYRYFEPRINLLCGEDEQLKKNIYQIVGDKGYLPDEYTVLKIDLRTGYHEKNEFSNASYLLDFYHDTMYPSKDFVYTYGLIHPRFISVVDIDSV